LHAGEQGGKHNGENVTREKGVLGAGLETQGQQLISGLATPGHTNLPGDELYVV
jgi:hypothetical protein